MREQSALRGKYLLLLGNPLPHPDDILIDFRSGRVRTAGPMTKEEKADWEKRLARRDEAQVEMSEFAKLHKRARTESQK